MILGPILIGLNIITRGPLVVGQSPALTSQPTMQIRLSSTFYCSLLLEPLISLLHFLLDHWELLQDHWDKITTSRFIIQPEYSSTNELYVYLFLMSIC